MVAVFFGEALGAYGFGDDHPFGPDRINAFWQETVKQGLDKKLHICAPELASQQTIELFHTPEYVARVMQQSVTGQGFLDYGDTPAFAGVYEAAANVVGSGLEGLEQLMSGQQNRVFVPIAGLHHARRDTAAGFCVFNDAGVLIEVLRAHYGLRKVAYIDIDAHHGDGVFYAFEDDPELIFADIHEDGRYLYPGTGFAHETGIGKATGTKLNIPVAPGADDAEFHREWPNVESFLRQHKPEIILFQAGADSIKGDPITHMQFTPAAHRHAAMRLCKLADEFCNGRIIAFGGGGYNRTNLALGWNAVVEAMLTT